MADTTAIEWCDSTFNPWIGCTRVSPACDDCYAARSTPARTLAVAWGPGEPRRRTADSTWALPKKWNAQQFVQCASCGWRGELRDFKGTTGWTMCPACSGADWHGARRRVFCASLADVFDNEVPDEWRLDLFRLIAATPDLDWLLVTKRIGNVARMLGDHPTVPLLPNIWLGITVVNQAEADRDVPKLLRVPARVRFLSIEPMLGPLDLTNVPVGGGHGHHEFEPVITGNVLRRADRDAPHVHWVICGGESGPKARPMHPDWARSLRDQCAADGVPFLWKQWGEWVEADRDGDMVTATEASGIEVEEGRRYDLTTANGAEFIRVGKKAAGRLLDGRTHDGFPGSES